MKAKARLRTPENARSGVGTFICCAHTSPSSPSPTRELREVLSPTHSHSHTNVATSPPEASHPTILVHCRHLVAFPLVVITGSWSWSKSLHVPPRSVVHQQTNSPTAPSTSDSSIRLGSFLARAPVVPSTPLPLLMSS